MNVYYQTLLYKKVKLLVYDLSAVFKILVGIVAQNDAPKT